MYSGQKCVLTLHNFANSVIPVQLLMITLNMPTEHCNPCQYQIQDSIHTPLALWLTYLLQKASTVSSQLLIVSLSLHISYPVPCGKINCQLHKFQKYCLKTLLGYLECQKTLLMIIIAGLLLNFGVNYSIFLVLKPVPPLLFTYRVMVKMNAPTIHSNKSCRHIFITNLY